MNGSAARRFSPCPLPAPCPAGHHREFVARSAAGDWRRAGSGNSSARMAAGRSRTALSRRPRVLPRSARGRGRDRGGAATPLSRPRRKPGPSSARGGELTHRSPQGTTLNLLSFCRLREAPVDGRKKRQAKPRPAREREGFGRERRRHRHPSGRRCCRLAEKARKSSERFVEEGRRRFPEAEEYYRQGREALSSQVQEGPLLAVLVAGALGYLLAYLIHGGGTPYRRSDAPPFVRRPPINEAQRHGVQQDPRERAEALRRGSLRRL